MALKGTLADLGIVDLIQFPHSGRKTGKLVVMSDNREVELYYENGALIHAALGADVGMEALVKVLDWTEGKFEFMPDMECPTRTIELDLHRAVMQAVKLHDELKLEEDRRKARVPTGSDQALEGLLKQFINGSESAQSAMVLSQDGTIIAAAHRETNAVDGLQDLVDAMYKFVRSYPRSGLGRVIAEDASGILVSVNLKGKSLIVLASKDASLGAVSVSVNRLAAGIE